MIRFPLCARLRSTKRSDSPISRGTRGRSGSSSGPRALAFYGLINLIGRTVRFQVEGWSHWQAATRGHIPIYTFWTTASSSPRYGRQAAASSWS